MSKCIKVIERTKMHLQTDGWTNGRHVDGYIPETYQSGDKKWQKWCNNYIQIPLAHPPTMKKTCNILKWLVKNCKRSFSHKTSRANVDGWMNIRMDEQTDTCTPTMLKQVRQQYLEVLKAQHYQKWRLPQTVLTRKNIWKFFKRENILEMKPDTDSVFICNNIWKFFLRENSTTNEAWHRRQVQS